MDPLTELKELMKASPPLYRCEGDVRHVPERLRVLTGAFALAAGETYEVDGNLLARLCVFSADVIDLQVARANSPTRGGLNP